MGESAATVRRWHPVLRSERPSDGEGGDVSTGGLHYLHQGEYVVPERFAAAARAADQRWIARWYDVHRFDLRDVWTYRLRPSGTMGGGFAQSAGVNSATELRQLKEAMLKSRQHIETHIHGREAGDDEFLSRSIAFRAKIPTS